MTGTNTGAFQFDNNYLTLREIQEQDQLDFINKMYTLYDLDSSSAIDFANIFLAELKGTTSTYKGIYVEKGFNNKQYSVYVYDYSDFSFSFTGSYTIANSSFVNITYMKGVFYERSINSDNSFSTSVIAHSNKSVPYPFLRVLVPEWKQMFIDFGLIQTSVEKELLARLDLLIAQTQQSDNQVANKIEQGNQLQQQQNQLQQEQNQLQQNQNQLQQEQNQLQQNQNQLQQEQNQLQQNQNQLQQEQNDFLKQESIDSDVSVDGFNNINSNDITSNGLSGVFTNIYNSITSWSSKDIKLPIPYTNKNITIPANYTQNMLSSSGGSWIITFVSSIYYFIVARFIIYSITGIVNSIKSGSILETDSKNNITTDML